jgi:hypothetical protein
MHAALQALHVGTERSSCSPVVTFPFHFSWQRKDEIVVGTGKEHALKKGHAAGKKEGG